MKTCTKCKIPQNIERFDRDKQTKDGRQPICKKCRRSYDKKRRSTPEFKAKHRAWHLKRAYNMRIVDFNLMLREQRYKCASCKLPLKPLIGTRKIAVDHDHSSDKVKVRGILCSNCNQGLGHFFDNIKFMENAIKYLKKHKKS